MESVTKWKKIMMNPLKMVEDSDVSVKGMGLEGPDSDLESDGTMEQASGGESTTSKGSVRRSTRSEAARARKKEMKAMAKRLVGYEEMISEMAKEIAELKKASSPEVKRKVKKRDAKDTEEGMELDTEEEGIATGNRFATLNDVDEEGFRKPKPVLPWKRDMQQKKEEARKIAKATKKPNESQKEKEVVVVVDPKEGLKEKETTDDVLIQEKEAEVTMQGPLLTPIIITKMNTANVVKEMEKSKMRPNMRRNGRTGVTTMLVTEEEKPKVMEILAANDGDAHSYPCQGDKYFCKMLMNLDNSYKIETIHAEIMELLNGLATTFGEFIVVRLVTNHSRRNNITLPYVTIKCADAHTLSLITSLREIFYVRPQWEDVRKPQYTQCYNCLELGHSRVGGCIKPRGCKACLATGEDHVCKVRMLPAIDENGNKQNPYLMYQCRLCLEFGHPATWAGCEKIQKTIEKIADARWNKQQRIAVEKGFIDAPRPRNNVWAQRRQNQNPPPRENAAQQQPAQQQQPQQREAPRPHRQEEEECSASSFIDDEIKRLLGMSAENLQRIAKAFVAKYKTLKSEEQQAAALATYFLEVNKWRK